MSRTIALSLLLLITLALSSLPPAGAGRANVAAPAHTSHGADATSAPPAAGWTFETVRHLEPFCQPFIRLAGFDFDPQNRPVLGWSEASGCGGVNNFRWSRREAGGWVENTITPYSCCGGVRAAQPEFVLRDDGTPFFGYAVGDAFIFGQDWYRAHIVDLGANPTGHGSAQQPIGSTTDCISAHPRFAMDFAPGEASPRQLVGASCQLNGWLALQGAAVHGSPPFRTSAGVGGDFSSLDYAIGPGAAEHLTYYAERGGASWGAYYSNGSPGHELLLVQPHRNRGAETSVAVGADGRIHVAIGGAPLCDNAFEGGLLYLTSTDGVNWARTFVDTVSGRAPSIALDAAGNPRIAYWRFANEVRYASLDGGAWSTTAVHAAAAGVNAASVKLAFDADDRPHVLFFNADASDIQIASGAPSDLPPAVTNPGAQASDAGADVSLQIEASDAEGGALSYSACGLPPGLSINPADGLINGTVTPGTPAGSYRVTITVGDPAGNSVSVGFDWNITVNQPPALTNPGDRTNAEGDVVSLQLVASDPEGGALEFSAAGLPPGLSIDTASGLIAGSPDYNSAGAYQVSVGVSDGSLSDTESFVWTINDTNRAPTAVADAFNTDEDTPLNVAAQGVLANDADADGDLLTAQLDSGVSPAAGTLIFNADGSFAYTPRLNFTGAVSFTYSVTDGGGGESDVVTVSINVAPVNDAPTVTNPGDRTDAENSTVSLQVSAADVDGDSLTYAAAGLPPGLSINASSGLISGSLGFDAAGSYPVTVNVTDGSLSASTSFNWTVTNVNRAPVAADASAATDEDAGVEIALAASDPDGDALTCAIVGGPAHGSATLSGGVVTYTPAPNYHGTDSFTFRAHDRADQSNVATVLITVSPVNDAPAARDEAAMTDEDAAVGVNVLANDADIDGDALSIQSVTGGAHGTLAIDGGMVVYKPEANFHGADSFSYTASDGHGGTSEATVSVTVAPVNDAPAASDDSAATPEDAAVQIAVLSNDTDVDGDAPALASVTQPANGAAAINQDGTVTYTPAPNFFGADSFAYTVSDGRGGAATAAVSVAVSAVNDAPVASDGAAALDEDTRAEVTLVGADIDSAALGFAVVGAPLNGTLSAVAGDKVIYTPNPNFNGADSFTFVANDGAADSNVATVTINVVPVADPPVLATVGDRVVAEGSPLSFTLSASDPDGDQLTFSATGLPGGASLDPATGAFSWTPTYEQAGAYTVPFTVTDPVGLSASETITITVNDVEQNLGPVCSAAYPSISEIWPPNHHRTEAVGIFGVTDPDNDPLTITVRRILQDEPTNTLGDGNTWIDGGGLGTPQAWVRAERSGTPRVPGNGRVYEIFFEASDGRGKVCTGSVKVGVPHDQGGGRVLVDDGKRYDSTLAGGACLNCQ